MGKEGGKEGEMARLTESHHVALNSGAMEVVEKERK
jgi:hypothetical protein